MSKAENKLAEELAKQIAALFPDPAMGDSPSNETIASLLEPHLVGEWLPIAGAPKDKAVVLGSVDCEIIGHGYAQYITELCTEGHAPTHWQLDPAPPKGEQSTL